MQKNNQLFFTNCKILKKLQNFCNYRFILTFISAGLMLPIQELRSEEIFLTCTGKFEINRGPLIEPDWETSYLTINLDGMQSIIDDKVIKKKGTTLIRRNSYIIKYKDNKNRDDRIYNINKTYGTYIVESPKINKMLIGTCQKGRG